MDNITRPAEIGSQDLMQQSDANSQEYTQTQLQNIYDYLDNVASQLNSISVLDQVYPVGSIYMSFNNVSPANFIGGTWERINDCFLWATSVADNVGQTGGNYSQTISHTHTLNCSLESNKGSGNGVAYTAGSIVWNGDNAISTDTRDISIMPPYTQVNMWKRTQ